MTIPLIVLAALSVLGGVMLLSDWIVEWLAPVVGERRRTSSRRCRRWRSPDSCSLVVAVGAGLAFVLVGRREVPREAPQDVSFVTRAARADLYGDAINDGLVVEPSRHLTAGLVTVDRAVVDGTFSGGATTVGAHRHPARRVQNGFVRSYAVSILAGVLLVVLALAGGEPRDERPSPAHHPDPGAAGGRARRSRSCRPWATSRSGSACSSAWSTLAVGHRHRGVVRRRRRRHAADRDPRVDLGVRRALRARRRRARSADDPADRRSWSRS